MPKYKIKMPQGANTDTHKTNGTQPNQNFEKICPKTKFLTPFTKNPQFKNPKLISTYSKKKMKRMLRKHTFKLILQKSSLKMMGFDWKLVLGWERFEWGNEREIESVLKICHISPIKLKTRIFRGLDSCEITREKHHWSTKLFTRSY